MDGVQVGSDAAYAPTALASSVDNTQHIGKSPHAPTDAARGVFDEVVIELGIGSARSAAWIATEHASQTNPGGFISVGAPGSVGGAELAVNALVHAHASGRLGLGQSHGLAIGATGSSQTAMPADLAQTHGLMPFANLHPGLSEAAVLTAGLALTVDNARHPASSSMAILFQHALLDIAVSAHSHAVAAVSLLLASSGAPVARVQPVGSAGNRLTVGPVLRTLSIISSL